MTQMREAIIADNFPSWVLAYCEKNYSGKLTANFQRQRCIEAGYFEQSSERISSKFHNNPLGGYELDVGLITLKIFFIKKSMRTTFPIIFNVFSIYLCF